MASLHEGKWGVGVNRVIDSPRIPCCFRKKGVTGKWGGLNNDGMTPLPSRLRFAAGFVVVLAFAVTQADADYMPVQAGKAHCCATDSLKMRLCSADMIERRFAIYRKAGFDMLRVEGLDDSILAPNGETQDPKDLPYIQMARDSGFRIKLNIHSLDQPEWYLDLHPDSRLVNEDGGRARSEMSFWYPQLHQRVKEGTDAVFKYMAVHGLFHNVDLIAPDFGPASEPIYPAAWTQTGDAKKAGEAFWFYAPNARADFAVKMKVRYGTIDAANASWGTTFANFGQIVIPQPGGHPGPFWKDTQTWYRDTMSSGSAPSPPFWKDILTWYRDTKRDFVIFQIENFKKELAKYPEAHDIKLLLYVPGSHCSNDDWSEAITTGNGRGNIRIMCDSEFLLETARKEGCELQYTACENEQEVKYLVDYLNDHQINIPMWGENTQGAAAQIGHIADVVIDNHLAGLDYTKTSTFFEDDLITPTDLLTNVTEALTRIHQSFGDTPTAQR
jgi:hypothetical protein